MAQQRRRVLVTFLGLCTAALLAIPFAGCGGDDNGKNDGGEMDGTILDEGGGDTGTGMDGGGDGGTCSWCNNDGGCVGFGSACKTNGDCCGNNCLNGVCGFPMCNSDNTACAQNSDCCSGICTNNICQPLNNTCKTLGNKCSANCDCCSKRCANGLCEPSSFCTQPGDVCAKDTECCTGICNKPMNQLFGTCSLNPPGGPANCGQVDGVTCGGSNMDGGCAGFVPDGGFLLNDAGLPLCGGNCCSRDCAPYGLTGVLICQPVSGCHVVGDTCKKDSDCCGSAGLPNGPTMPVTCDKSNGYPIGICRNPVGCKPDGDICKLKTMTCNASCDCCSGNCQVKDTCHQDLLGVPRCSGPCVDAGSACASSANCCGKPCVPNGDGGYTCSPTSCQQCAQSCSITADCCPGFSCLNGACGPCSPDGGVSPDGGTPCAQLGQLCTVNSDCCDGIPCTNGRCGYGIN